MIPLSVLTGNECTGLQIRKPKFTSLCFGVFIFKKLLMANLKEATQYNTVYNHGHYRESPELES